MSFANSIRLQTDGLNYAYANKATIKNISLQIKEGQFVGLIGPNGSGKSTVLKNIYRALRPDSGQILLDGENLLTMNHRETAKKMAVVGQENDVPFDFTIEEIVAMGRSPYKRFFDTDNAQDKQIIIHALEHVGMEKMLKRNYLHLSGGEKQRVLIARAIAQESELLILDEPTNHLDISYQIQIFDLIKQLKRTVLSAIHDLNMAALYCDFLYVLKDGEIVLAGTPEEILTPENIWNVYGVHSFIERHPSTGCPSVTFIPDIKKEGRYHS